MGDSMKKNFCVFALIFVMGCGKHPLAPPSSATIKLISPENGSVVRNTQPTFDWEKPSGASLYRLIVFNATDTLIDQTLANDSYTAYQFLPRGEYRWQVFGSTDGVNFDIASPVWNFTLLPAPFYISSIFTMPAPVNDLFQYRDYIFAACNEAGIVVLKVTSSDSLLLIASVHTMDKAKALVADSSSGYLFVADYRGNLLVYDITNPEAPSFVNSQFARRVVDVKSVLVRDTLFVIAADEDNGILIFSVEPGGFITQHGSVTPVGGYCRSVDIMDTIVVAAANEVGIKIFSWAKPDSLVLVGELDLPGTSLDVKIHNGKAYVALGLSGVCIVDIHNPANPQLVSTYNPQLGNCVAVNIWNNYILAVMGSEGLFVFNGLEALRLTQQIDMPYAYSALGIQNGVLIGDRDWGVVWVK